MVNRILIADDDPIIIRYYRAIFDKENQYAQESDEDSDVFEVTTFPDGAPLVERFREEVSAGVDIPLCILDMRMPEMGGLEAAEKLRAVNPQVIVVIVTAHEDTSPKEMRDRLKRNLYYLKKPFDREELFSLVFSLLKNWRQQKTIETASSRYRHLVENASDLIFTSNQRGCFSFANPTAERITGYSLRELKGMHCLRLIPEDRRAEVAVELDHQQRNRLPSSYYEFPIQRRDGEIVWLGQNIQLVMHDGEVMGFQAVARDITARRRAEQALLEARQRELDASSRIEETLLQGRPPVAVRGAAVAALSEPSQHLDGDFYDFFSHGPTCFDVFLGDVMGKGMLAALVGAGAKQHFLRALAPDADSDAPVPGPPLPNRVVANVHEELAARLVQLERFITLCYARFDLAAGTLDFVDCGHTRTLVFRFRTAKCEFLEGGNLPLGFVEREEYESFSVPVEPGDLVLFYSDGVTEARSPAGEQFGQERLAELVSRTHGAEPEEVLLQLREAVSDFSGSRNLADDFTCISVAILPAACLCGELQISCGFIELARVRQFVRMLCEQTPEAELSGKDLDEIELAVHEAVANIIEHAYRGAEDKDIVVTGRVSPERASFRLYHYGDHFEPPAPAPDISEITKEPHPERGRGLYIIRQVFDEFRSESIAPGRECVTLGKTLK